MVCFMPIAGEKMPILGISFCDGTKSYYCVDSDAGDMKDLVEMLAHAKEIMECLPERSVEEWEQDGRNGKDRDRDEKQEKFHWA